MANDNDKTGDTGYNPREWEAVGSKPALRPSPEFMADPDVQRQLDFDDFINTPEGEKWLLKQLAKMNAQADTIDKYEHRADRQAVRQDVRRDAREMAKLEAERARHRAQVEEHRALDEYMRNPGPIEGRLRDYVEGGLGGVVPPREYRPSKFPFDPRFDSGPHGEPTLQSPPANNRNDLRSKTKDVSRKVLADEEEKLAPKHDKPLAADTE
ncbi:MAG: hypothetical protein Tp1123DCM257201_59 [Prokaryotic dsDNA virus sp.]|nr:MAG: hypothetical protein Tp1123DCM257201_59 [Prokaryotic dsDNA virus sp.]|tara:strand:+ start:15031 stop:15663 length:633 start_codon:yes stop_codon:yes gene_type:complete